MATVTRENRLSTGTDVTVSPVKRANRKTRSAHESISRSYESSTFALARPRPCDVLWKGVLGRSRQHRRIPEDPAVAEFTQPLWAPFSERRKLCDQINEEPRRRLSASGLAANQINVNDAILKNVALLRPRVNAAARIAVFLYPLGNGGLHVNWDLQQRQPDTCGEIPVPLPISDKKCDWSRSERTSLLLIRQTVSDKQYRSV